MTTNGIFRSLFIYFPAVIIILPFFFVSSCSSKAMGEPNNTKQIQHVKRVVAEIAPEACIGLNDIGIFSDLDKKLQISMNSHEHYTHLTTDNTLLLYLQGWPVKAYPLEKGKLRSGDQSELNKIQSKRIYSPKVHYMDRDHDGIPDPLDLLLGAKKTVLNGANYSGGYRSISYPNGDISREDGVCTDVIVRAVRNAGLDIQVALHEDIKNRPKAFPMVKKPNRNIDHRRVKTLLPYFKKHWNSRDKSLSNKSDPYRSGDIIFMDTFPKRSGPDHIGIVSNIQGENGYPLVINNWTDGYSTSEMDLLSFIPVTHRFRIQPPL